MRSNQDLRKSLCRLYLEEGLTKSSKHEIINDDFTGDKKWM